MAEKAHQNNIIKTKGGMHQGENLKEVKFEKEVVYLNS